MVLEQQLINEKDSTRVDALYQLLDNAKKERKAKETEAAEYKKSQKEKDITKKIKTFTLALFNII